MVIKKIVITAVTYILVFVFVMNNAVAETLVVDANGSGDFASIQDAIEAAWDYDTIQVNPGLYIEHINYHGMIITITSKEPNNPSIVENTIIDGNGTGNVVMFSNSEGQDSILQGLTITNGQNGIVCSGTNTKPIIRQCQIISNLDTGIVCTQQSKPTITECVIENNKNAGISGNYGGEISLCNISENGSGGNENAGLLNCTGLVSKCVISNNNGDGIYDHDGLVKNCLISGNEKNGIFLVSYNCDVNNCTVVGNKGTGAYYYAAQYGLVFNLRNSIIVLNGNYGVYSYNNRIINLDYSDIWGNVTKDIEARYPDSLANIKLGDSCISLDPLFAKRGYWDENVTWHEGEYHLKSKLGRWDTRTLSWKTDPNDSPCIDRGDPNDGFGDEIYPHGGKINMGAYGGTDEASMSDGPPPLCKQYPEMDFNKDCKVDKIDLDMFMMHWLECNLDPNDSCNIDPNDSYWLDLYNSYK